MSNIVPIPVDHDAAVRVEASYVTVWSDFYRATRSLMDRDSAMALADSHVAYLKCRDAEILAAVADATGATQ